MNIETRSKIRGAIITWILTAAFLASPFIAHAGDTNGPHLKKSHLPSFGRCLKENTFARRLRLANLWQSRLTLWLPDRWALQLSDYDRGARMRTTMPTDTREFLYFAAGAAVGWTDSERAAWRDIAGRVSVAAAGLNVRMPRMLLINTTGDEEFGGAYVRKSSIVIPERLAHLALTDERRAFFLLAHELFHVLSRFNRHQRDSLYSLLDVQRIPRMRYPAEFEGRRLSNPDAFEYRHAARVETFDPDGTSTGFADVVPIFQSGIPLEEYVDPMQPLPIFAFINVPLLSVDARTGRVNRDADGQPIARNFGDTDWLARMMRNSSFVVHPEEILADNFATLMEWRYNGGDIPQDNPSGFPINDPDLILNIQSILTAGCKR